MGLSGLKWLLMSIIFTASVAAGFATTHIVHRYKKLISLGEAFANGIFLGAAAFHLLPDAAAGLINCKHCSPVLDSLLLAAISFLLLMLFEHMITKKIHHFRQIVHVGPLLLTLSIHAFLTGIALGISDSYVVIVSIFIAIIAHKAFEMFALVINLHRKLKHNHHVRLLFLLFSFVTPLGILLGNTEIAFLPLGADNTLTACFNAICAGTFVYIATIHAHHQHHPYGDGYLKYAQILATIVGVVAMAVLSIWI